MGRIVRVAETIGQVSHVSFARLESRWARRTGLIRARLAQAFPGHRIELCDQQPPGLDAMFRVATATPPVYLLQATDELLTDELEPTEDQLAGSVELMKANAGKVVVLPYAAAAAPYLSGSTG